MSKSRKTKPGKPPTIIEQPEVPGITWCNNIVKRKRQWLVRDKIPANVPSIIEGRKECGKSTLLSAIAAAYTGGPILPGWEGRRDGRVLWMAGEEDWATEIRPRLESAAANIDRIAAVEIPIGEGTYREPRLPMDLRKILEMMAASGATMLIIDPLPSAMEDPGQLLNEKGCRSVMDPFNKVTSSNSYDIIVTRHIRGDHRVDVRHAGYGHPALANAARAVSRIDIDNHDRSRRLWSTVACNATRVRRTDVLLLRDGTDDCGCIEWAGTSPLSAQQIAETQMDDVALDEHIDATTILVSNLMHEWVKLTELMKIALQYGVSVYSLRRAAIKLGVRKDQERPGPGMPMEWGPPENGFPKHLVEMASAMGSARVRANHYPDGQIAGKIGKTAAKTTHEGVMPSAPPITPSGESEGGKIDAQ